MKEQIKERLADPVRREVALAEIATWVKDTCLMFGCHPGTAYLVAGEFVKGLEKQYR